MSKQAGERPKGRFTGLEELDDQHADAVIRGLRTRDPLDCAEVERLRVQLKKQVLDVRDSFSAMLRDDRWPLEHRQRMEEHQARAIDWIQKLETDKRCSHCCSPMQLKKRARPEDGPMFVGEDQWICEKCGRVEDAADLFTPRAVSHAARAFSGPYEQPEERRTGARQSLREMFDDWDEEYGAAVRRCQKTKDPSDCADADRLRRRNQRRFRRHRAEMTSLLHSDLKHLASQEARDLEQLCDVLTRYIQKLDTTTT